MLRIRKALLSPMKSPIRITAVRKPFDPEAFAAVLVKAALARLAEAEPQPAPKRQPPRRRGGRA